MSSDWSRVRGLLEEALDRPPAEREDFLRVACAGDVALIDEVTALLEAEAESSYLDGLVSIDAAFVGAENDDATAVFLDRARSLGSRFDRYVVLGELGRGGMGVVLRAEDRLTGRIVAMKSVLGRREVSPPRLGAKARALRRFVEEARITAGLEHPGIVPVHEVGVNAGGDPYFTMKLVDGEDLGAVFRKVWAGTPGWTMTRAVSLILRVAEAMAYAHARGVLHRDLKPANVMVGAFGEVYVVDWGVARSVEDTTRHDDGDDADANPRPAVTCAGEVLGTPHYMAPELAHGDRDRIGPAVDVYAIGAMLYHLAAGRPPYEAASGPAGADDARDAAATVRSIRSGPPAPLGSIAKVAPPLVAICARAMARDPRDRYPTMLALADDLRAFLDERVVAAHAHGPIAEFRTWLKRNRAFAAAVATAVLLLSTFAAWSFVTIRAERDQAERERQSVFRLAEARRLDLLLNEEPELWPAFPERVSAIAAWIARARDLVARLPDHRRTLVALDEALHTGGDPPTEEQLWHRERLAELISRLETFEGAAPTTDPGAPNLPNLTNRLAVASTIWRDSIEAHLDEWRAAVAAVAADPRFGGLRLEPRCGLVPLGADPDSGLQEFWHVRSGSRPARGDDGRHRVEDGSGLIFVLLPGGRFLMGAQSIDDAGPGYEPGAFGNEAGADGLPVEVALSPFLLSKFEMTQGQWTRLAGTNPAGYAAGGSFDGREISTGHPVENVSWFDCAELSRRQAFAIPTEAQWEYACRAGRTSRWFFGDDPAVSGSFANGADKTATRFMPFATCDPSVEDGHVIHAPVGSFAPNAFGLHDMIGNVWEWCRDLHGPYATPARAGDGERLHPDGTLRVRRGGSFNDPVRDLRCAVRSRKNPGSRSNAEGFRPAIALAP